MDPRSDSNVVTRDADGVAAMATVRDLFPDYPAAMGAALRCQAFA